MLSALGLKATKTDSRYDFTFTAKHGEEWSLSMSVVLSTDEKSVWIMAWLDELPQSAADVPRTALLRLLADNDKIGHGMFFSYVAGNRRFVLPVVCRLRRYGCTPRASQRLRGYAVRHGLLAVGSQQSRQGTLVVAPIVPGWKRKGPGFLCGGDTDSVTWSSLPCQQLGEQNVAGLMGGERRREQASPGCRVDTQPGICGFFHIE